MNIQCVLCLNNITNSTDRYILDKSTKSGTEAGKLLENLPFEVNVTPVLGKNLYVCKKCFRELKKRKISYEIYIVVRNSWVSIKDIRKGRFQAVKLSTRVTSRGQMT